MQDHWNLSIILLVTAITHVLIVLLKSLGWVLQGLAFPSVAHSSPIFASMVQSSSARIVNCVIIFLIEANKVSCAQFLCDKGS